MCQIKNVFWPTVTYRDFFHEEEIGSLNRSPTISDPWEYQ
jgi:hypothetical protein